MVFSEGWIVEGEICLVGLARGKDVLKVSGVVMLYPWSYPSHNQCADVSDMR